MIFFQKKKKKKKKSCIEKKLKKTHVNQVVPCIFLLKSDANLLKLYIVNCREWCKKIEAYKISGTFRAFD